MDSELHYLESKLHAVMKDFKPFWFVAGGWAIDLFVGERTREHEDVEIAIFRKDQLALQDYFNGWRLQKVVDGKLSPWHEGEWLEMPVHELYCLNESAEIEKLEILLNESNEHEWIYRRDERIRRVPARSYLATTSGLKFLSPEIVLLYKSRDSRAKDEQDFSVALEQMEAERRQWLRDAIAACDKRHPWLKRL